MIIIGNGKLLTFNESDPFYENGAVVIDGPIIIGFGDFGELRSAHPDVEFIDAGGAIIMPGLIDMHAHSRNMLLRGAPVPRYKHGERHFLFERFLRRAEAASPDDSITAAYASAVNCIRMGITTVFEHHFEPKHISASLRSIASVYRECGIRSCLCYEVSDRFGVRNTNTAIRENLEFFEFCRDLDVDTVRPMFGLDSTLNLSEETLDECLKANDGRSGFHFHLELTPEERMLSIRKHGKSPVRRLIEMGIASEGSIAAGCVFTKDDDLALIHESGCGIVLTPMLSQLLSSAYGGAFELLASSGDAAIGTDTLCLSPMDAARTAVSQFSLGSGYCENVLLSASGMLFKANAELASRCFSRRVGVIEVGAFADVIVVRPDSFTAKLDGGELTFGLIGGAHPVCELTMVAGRTLMRHGKLINVDEDSVIARLQKARCRVGV